MKLALTGSQVLLWRAAQKAAGVATAIVVMQGLGPEGNGRYSLTVTIITVLGAVLSAGVGLASVPRLRDGEESPRRILRAQGAWLLVVAGVLVILALLTRDSAPWGWLEGSLGWHPGLLAAVPLAVLGLVAYETANYDLLAAGRVVVGTVTASGRALLLLAAMVLLLLVWSHGIVAAVLALVGAHALAGLVLGRRAWVTVTTRLPADGRARTPLPRLAGRLVRHGWLGQLSALIYLLLLRLDQFLLESSLDVRAVGLYAAAAWAAELLWLVPEALNPLLVHSSSNQADRHRDRTAARAVRLGLGLTALAAIPLAVVCEPLLALVRDGEFQAAAAPLRVLLPGIVAFAPGVILAGDFIGRGRPAWNTHASAVTVVVNVALCLLWIPRFGIMGAAWASTVAYTLGAAIMMVRFQRLTGTRWADLLVPRPSDLRR
ncbi:oligosaccharide flippase family protein [bacterium]|nr:oligosaccharide flippase family protein [bacterium]